MYAALSALFDQHHEYLVVGERGAENKRSRFARLDGGDAGAASRKIILAGPYLLALSLLSSFSTSVALIKFAAALRSTSLLPSASPAQ